MDEKGHWEQVYKTKPSTGVSWYRPHLDYSLRLIQQVAPDPSSNIIDVGAGSSTLVDDLLSRGYSRLTLLDLSASALAISRARLGAAADGLKWIASGISEAVLPSHQYDVWHDRAVFHFLVDESQRRAYLEQLRYALKPHGYLVLGTFGANGPEKCSGLPVRRYSLEAMQGALGADFRLTDSATESHATPAGGTQQFQYGVFQRSAD